MGWLEQVAAAQQRLEAGQRSSSRCWRLRHLRAAERLLAEAVAELEAERVPRERRLDRLAPIRAGQL